MFDKHQLQMIWLIKAVAPALPNAANNEDPQIQIQISFRAIFEGLRNCSCCIVTSKLFSDLYIYEHLRKLSPDFNEIWWKILVRHHSFPTFHHYLIIIYDQWSIMLIIHCFLCEVFVTPERID